MKEASNMVLFVWDSPKDLRTMFHGEKEDHKMLVDYPVRWSSQNYEIMQKGVASSWLFKLGEKVTFIHSQWVELHLRLWLFSCSLEEISMRRLSLNTPVKVTIKVPACHVAHSVVMTILPQSGTHIGVLWLLEMRSHSCLLLMNFLVLETCSNPVNNTWFYSSYQP